MAKEHLSDSVVQRAAESAIIQALAAQLRVELLGPRRVEVAGGAYMQLDAASKDDGVLVEAYARQGVLKGAQIKKISQDILKLALIKQDPTLSRSRAIVVFASEEARRSITGWIRSAAEQFGVELMVVEIADEVRAEIIAAQARQVMVNIELPAGALADDVSVPEAASDSVMDEDWVKTTFDFPGVTTLDQFAQVLLISRDEAAVRLLQYPFPAAVPPGMLEEAAATLGDGRSRH